jgi:ribosomal protein L35
MFFVHGEFDRKRRDAKNSQINNNKTAEQKRQNRKMNFLTSALGSLTGSSIPYTFGDEYAAEPTSPPSIWRVFDGIKKVSFTGSSAVTTY